MTDSQKLDLILDKVGGLETRMDRLESRMDGLETRMDRLETRMDSLEVRMDVLEVQIKKTESVLREEIGKSEFLVLDEVERVHMILDRHTLDNSRHIGTLQACT